MPIRFQPPAHGEAGILRSNAMRSSRERIIRSTVTPTMAMDLAARADVLGANVPGDGAIAVSMSVLGIPLEININAEMAQRMSMAAEFYEQNWNEPASGAEENASTLENDVFDWRPNSTGDFAQEILQWWQRSPGEAVGNAMPNQVRGASRWFGLSAEFAVDSITDRVLRAATHTTQTHSVQGLDDVSNFLGNFFKEYWTAENTGQSPFIMALDDLRKGEEVNLSTGFIANSDIAPLLQEHLDAGDRDSASYADGVYEMWDDEEWNANNASFATPWSQSKNFEVNRRNLAMEMGLRDPAANQQQMSLGRPITEMSRREQDTSGGAVNNMFGWSPSAPDSLGRKHYSQQSVGRLMALPVTEPGSKEHQIVSGGVDLGKQLIADPYNYIRPFKIIDEAFDARRGIGLTEQAATRVRGTDDIRRAVAGVRDAPSDYSLDEILALKNAGIDVTSDLPTRIREAETFREGMLLAQRARPTVQSGQVNQWLTGYQAEPFVNALTEAKTMREVNALLSNTKGRIPSKMLAELKDATTQGEVIEALIPHVSGMRLRGTMSRSSGITSANMSDLMRYGNPFLWIEEATNGALDILSVANKHELPSALGGITPRARVRAQYGHTWAGRMMNNQSNKAIRLDDTDVGYGQFENLIRNAGMKADTRIAKTTTGRIIEANSREELMGMLEVGERISGTIKDMDDALYRFAGMGNYNGPMGRDSVKEMLEGMGLSMEADGINPIFIRAVVQMTDDMGEDSRFMTNAMGEITDHPGTGFMHMSGDDIMRQPGVQLISEMYSQKTIDIPNPRVLRRTLAEKHRIGRVMNTLTTHKTHFRMAKRADGSPDGSLLSRAEWKPKGDLQDNAAMRFARAYINDFWKPAKLIRTGYIAKVILGDEQIRQMVSGLATFMAPGRITKGDNPLAYFSILLGRKAHLDVNGKPLREAASYQANVSLRGNVFGETGAMGSDNWDAALKTDLPRYTDSIATEYLQMVNDPISSYMAGIIDGDQMAMTKEWLLNTAEGQRVLSFMTTRIRQQNPILADRFRTGGQELDNYLEWVMARQHLKTGGEYVYRDRATNTLFDSADRPMLDDPQYGPGITITRKGESDLLKGINTGHYITDEMAGHVPRDVGPRKLPHDGQDAQAPAMMAMDDIIPLREFDRSAVDANPSSRATIDHFIDKWRGKTPEEIYKMEGARELPIIEIDRQGYVILIEGNHRIAAAMELGLEEFPVRVMKTDNPSVWAGTRGRRGAEGVKKPRDPDAPTPKPKEPPPLEQPTQISDTEWAYPNDGVRIIKDEGTGYYNVVSDNPVVQADEYGTLNNAIHDINQALRPLQPTPANVAVGPHVNDISPGAWDKLVEQYPGFGTGGYIPADLSAGDIFRRSEMVPGKDRIDLTDAEQAALKSGTKEPIILNNNSGTQYERLRERFGELIEETEANFLATGDTASIRFPEGVKTSRTNYDHISDETVVHKIADRLMDWIVAKPAEKLNRGPTYDQFYWQQVAELIPHMEPELAAKMVDQAKEVGMWGRVKRIMADVGEQPRAINDIKEVDMYAHAYAATALKDLLFDFAQRKNFFDAMTIISPFADAWLEMFTSYSRIFAKDPAIVRRPMKALEELRDDDFTEWGEEEFDLTSEGFFHTNQYGDEVFSVPFSAGISDALSKLPGVNDDIPALDMEIGVKNLNMMAGSLYPVVGPVITIPAAGIIPDTPAFQGLKDFIAPYGMEETLIEEFIAETFGASPTLTRILNSFWEGSFIPGSGDERMYANTTGWVLRDMERKGEFTAGDLNDRAYRTQLLEDANSRAAGIYFVRGVAQGVMPASPGNPKFFASPEDWANLDDDAKIIALAIQDGPRMYWDMLNDEFDGDHEATTMEFMDRYGYDPTFSLVSMSETESRRGFTRESYEWELNHADYASEFPATVYFLHPDDPNDEWYYKAYEAQFLSGIKTVRSPSDQLDDYLYRMTALEYDNYEKQLLSDAADGTIQVRRGESVEDAIAGMLDVKEKELLERFGPYAERVGTFTRENKQKRLTEVRAWTLSDKLKNDPDTRETVKAVENFFGFWDGMFEAQLEAGIGSKGAKVFPFERASSKVGGENWTQRLHINTQVLEYGDTLALMPRNGRFSVVWREVIRPTIYDYRQDMPQPEVEEEGFDVDELIERVFG